MLKDHGNPGRRRHTDRLAMDEKGTAAEICEARDTAQERGLAAARGTHDAHDLVTLDRERQLMKGDDGAIEEQLAGTLGEDYYIHGFVTDPHASLVTPAAVLRWSGGCGKCLEKTCRRQMRASARGARVPNSAGENAGSMAWWQAAGAPGPTVVAARE